MFKNLSNYRLVNNVAGKPSFARTSPNSRIDYQSTGFYAGYQTTQSPQSVNFANPNSTSQSNFRILDGIVNIDDPKSLRVKYKDMYYFDNIAGTAVDLRAELPFSEFTLTGISDPTILKVYEDCMVSMKALQFLRRMMVDYFVYGACAYQLIFNEEQKIFYSPKPLNLNNCTFTPTPLLNDEPFIDYTPDDYLKPFIKLIESGDKRAVEYLKNRPGLNKLFLSKAGEKLCLDPETTLYFERNDLTTPIQNTYNNLNQLSYYARALKFYEYEKRIYRGTMDLAEKRLKSILHVQIGNESIFPEEEALTHVANLFKTANLDPTDAIVATPYYVTTNEVRSPTDFWRYDESYEFCKSAKLTALGINEEFLSGTANYNSMEMALSVFLEQLKADRTYVTDYFFGQKIFPYVAKQNGFIAEDDQQTIKRQLQEESRDVKLDPFNQEKQFQKKVRYQIPGVHYFKQLKPQGDKEYMDMLQSLKDQGVPIPFRMLISAAGLNTDELLDQLREDKPLQEEFERYSSGYGEEGQSENMPQEQERFREEAPESSEEQQESALRNSGWLKPLGLKARAKLGDLNGSRVNEQLKPYKIVKGKRIDLSKREQEMYSEKSNKVLSEVLAAKNEREIFEENKKWQEIKESK